MYASVPYKLPKNIGIMAPTVFKNLQTFIEEVTAKIWHGGLNFDNFTAVNPVLVKTTIKAAANLLISTLNYLKELSTAH